MKNKTIQGIGKILLAIVVVLIVVIFSIWYLAYLERREEMKPIETTTTNETQPVQQTSQEPAIRKLSAKELEDISEQLNTAKDNPFIALLYMNPKEIKISDLTYNGAIGTTTISDSEKMQIASEIRKRQLEKRETFTENKTQAYLQGTILKLKRSDIEQYFKEKTGLVITVPKDNEDIGIYLEETDSYYQAIVNTSFTPIFCDSGTLDPATGIYEVEYHNLMAETASEKFVVQMQKSPNGFIFISNRDKKD